MANLSHSADRQGEREREREMKVYSSADHQASDFSIPNAFDSQFLNSSDSLSLPSEPPDIRNWFSSYVYESPVLDSDELGGCVFKKCESEREGFGIEEIPLEKEEDLSEFRRIENIKEVEFGENANQSVPKGDQWERNPPYTNNLPSETVAEHRAEDEKTSENHSDFSNQDLEGSNMDDASFQWKQQTLSEEPVFILVSNKSKNSCLNNKRSPEKLVHREDFVKESSESKTQTEKVDNEINASDLPGNGFISTRKNNKTTRRNDENSLLQRQPQPQQEKVGSLRNVKRKVLAEKTNIQSYDALEIAGKWRCPQKSKPNLGPPLKQLRLEQWVHRV